MTSRLLLTAERWSIAGLARSCPARPLDQVDGRPLKGTRTARVGPFFSRTDDGSVSERRSVTSKVAEAGGPPDPCGSSVWPAQGRKLGNGMKMVFRPNESSTGLLRVPSGGGPIEVLTRPNPSRHESDHLFPFILPGGNAVLFTLSAPSQRAPWQIALLDLGSGTWKAILPEGSQPEYVDPVM